MPFLKWGAPLDGLPNSATIPRFRSKQSSCRGGGTKCGLHFESLGLSRKTFRVSTDCSKTFASGWLPPESDS